MLDFVLKQTIKVLLDSLDLFASEECIMVHSESVCQYKPVRDLIVGDKFVSRGNVTQSISSIDITNDVQLYYSLDLKDDNNYFVGGSNSVMSWDSYW